MGAGVAGGPEHTAAVPEPGGLAGHLDGFVRAVRDAGIPVGISQAVDAAEILTVVDLLDREQLRHGLAAVLLQRAAQRPAYDVLFDLWWPLSDRPALASAGDEDDGEPGEPGEPTLDLPDGTDLAQLMREELARLLLDGDEEALRRFARDAVDQLGRTAPSPSGQSFFSYRVMRALSPDTLVAQLLAGLLGDAGRGGLAEQVARQTVRERLAAFRAAVEAEVRRRTAAERGRDKVAKNAVRPLADQVDFLRAQAADLAELRRTVAPLARRLAVRLSARRRLGREGRLDFRRTVRASLGTGGVPVVTHHRPRKVHKPELVVLCDVSGSVAGFSHFTLMLTQALREHFSGVRAFAFVDSTDEVSRFFRPGADVVDAVARIGREADVVGFDGHSDYGTAFEVFADRWASVVGPKTSLLVLGDGRTNYRPPGLPVLADLVRRSRTAHWLNPEPRRLWGSGDSAANRYGEVVDMVECRNAAQLADFVTTL
ncbi:vWA domain-containing protein [Geodermatophilus obscurus]|uniref:VWA containing CoxE family protein n=1 Tax=Geodermatophilus obscurus (strain ATCC 25078 / DSM 43160 / JCM 3152 / CCUG 61914 / KCC A-0152 / KCTC 9177 / NBRC 13315 / NRRL B-3577 / G-20) TaxID=526225 RepID=D2SCT9_GEOOG|nr:VWA domain-containing protein [Geodermatophilus obscurus]ADB74324.1 VWA containing CoxE family protein [Geodermatophilus obscurus DSM 43160]